MPYRFYFVHHAPPIGANRRMGHKMMSRRDFVLQSTAVISAAAGVAGHAKAADLKYKMGLQLYSVQAPLAKDLTGSIKKIAAVGYEDSETYG
jgi:hypothetical protein